jgi:hypothetical protein
MTGKTLGDRMKDYEKTSNFFLQRKIPVIHLKDNYVEQHRNHV